MASYVAVATDKSVSINEQSSEQRKANFTRMLSNMQLTFFIARTRTALAISMPMHVALQSLFPYDDCRCRSYMRHAYHNVAKTVRQGAICSDRSPSPTWLADREAVPEQRNMRGSAVRRLPAVPKVTTNNDQQQVWRLRLLCNKRPIPPLSRPAFILLPSQTS